MLIVDCYGVVVCRWLSLVFVVVCCCVLLFVVVCCCSLLSAGVRGGLLAFAAGCC